MSVKPLTRKEFNRLERKLSDAAQAAYMKVCADIYIEELSHVVTEEENIAFRARWKEIADKLEDGWILDLESI